MTCISGLSVLGGGSLYCSWGRCTTGGATDERWRERGRRAEALDMIWGPCWGPHPSRRSSNYRDHIDPEQHLPVITNRSAIVVVTWHPYTRPDWLIRLKNIHLVPIFLLSHLFIASCFILKYPPPLPFGILHFLPLLWFYLCLIILPVCLWFPCSVSSKCLLCFTLLFFASDSPA